MSVIDLRTGEITEVDDVTTLAIPGQVTVPELIDDTVAVLNDVGRLLGAGHWATAALVYAWTTDELNGRGNRVTSDGVLSLEAFTEKGIRGLKSINTVRKYRRAWEHAMDQGWVGAAVPGERVLLPGQPFTTGPGDAEHLIASNENEWYTPATYVEAARLVLGGIDLDPATSKAANETVRARRFYIAQGLEQPWSGRVWLNPPYGRLAGDFSSKLVGCYVDGTVSAAVLLVNAHCTDTAWFQPLWDYTLCFTNHRIDFDSNDRDKDNTSTHGSVFVYFGRDQARFAEEFNQFGALVRRYQR